jgi:hypothetical protein
MDIDKLLDEVKPFRKSRFKEFGFGDIDIQEDLKEHYKGGYFGITGFRWTGKKFSEEHKKSISEAMKGRTFSKEHREALSRATKGKKKSKEHKENLAKAQSEHCKTKGNQFKGRKHSEETKKKISEATKKQWDNPSFKGRW